MKPVAATNPRIRLRLRHLLPVLVIVVGLYAVLPQIGNFKSSWHLLGHPRPGWVAAGIGLTAATYLAAAGTYCFLAFRPLRYGLTVVMQMAAMFVNRLLPGGLGALGANFLYLRKSGHSGTQAGSLVAINNLLGFLGHMLILAIVFVAYGGHLPALNGRGHTSSRSLELLVVILVAAAIVLLIVGRQRAGRFVKDLGAQLAAYRQRPLRLLAALGSSMVLTLSNVLSFYVCALALGLHLPFAVALLVFTLGVGTSTAVPTPGGLGAFEAGLVGGMVAYHVNSSLALAVALLYRFISYWLALAVGAVAFAYAEKRQLLT